MKSHNEAVKTVTLWYVHDDQIISAINTIVPI